MNSRKKFALIGAAGFVAPRHMKAIRDTGHSLKAAVDPHDCVGVMDSFFPEAAFFTEFERFDRHIDKLSRKGKGLDYVTVCSPNYLHDAHIRFGLRNQADVICEKPLVLNPWNLDALAQIEAESNHKIYTLLQLRLHPAIIALKEKIEQGPSDKTYDLDLVYLTSRGNWYYASWKGDVSKSGGIATNIGIHFFDMLIWIFGGVKSQILHIHNHDRAAGYLELERARIRWFLGIQQSLLPEAAISAGKTTYRSLQVEGEEIEFSDGFTNLHTTSYQSILNGQGFGLETARPSIELVSDIRHAQPIGPKGDYHPLAKIPLDKHPFEK